MELAEILPFASGYAAEPQELVSMFESFSGILPTKDIKVMEQGIDIFQSFCLNNGRAFSFKIGFLFRKEFSALNQVMLVDEAIAS
jgi:hypothetical protein